MMCRGLFFVLFALWCAGSGAEDALSDRAEAEAAANARIDDEREREFLRRKERQAETLSRERETFERLTAQSEELEAEFETNRAKLAELETIYRQRAGDSTEVFALVRRGGAEFKASLAESFIGLLAVDWQQRIDAITDKEEVFDAQKTRDFGRLMLEVMALQSGSYQKPTDIIRADGRVETRQAVFVGEFSAMADGQFLKYLPNNGIPAIVPRQPAARYLSVAAELAAGTAVDENGFVATPIDVSRGTIFSILEQSPNIIERVGQGGVIAAVILILGAIGFALVIERLFVLVRTERAVSAQKDNAVWSDDNPLGRLMNACKGTELADCEEMELRLHDAVLRETQMLERGFGIIKALASIAPLLGLLGTVVGMIETFQAITLFGAGDARVMAGGISQALVTTMLGLGAAIPLLLLYVIATGRSRRIRQILEQQSAGVLVARILPKAGDKA